ncbi:type VI secretion system baseplate subunit TssF [Yokenella regensburgei]|uniref:type VI secretion system baseplate subunit TssF n=1 Tax=Yokenella regensburgei TaxID=158877 RepID=UPI003F136C1B
MDVEERYYREELDYLRQLGKLLAKEKPFLAHFLKEKQGDTDVERLMESFAFLSGRLRQKLEDEFPEFTHGIIRMLWPNYLRPVPAMTVIKYEPEKTLKIPVQILRNELISTGTLRIIRPEGNVLGSDTASSPPACHFTLARNIWLQPLAIKNVRNASSLDEGIIDIEFYTDKGITADTLDLNKISFWLGNHDDNTRYQLYLWLSERLMDAEIIMGNISMPLPNLWLDPAGFEREDALLSWPKNIHNGYRILHEYFCYPESFFFFHLRDAEPLMEDFRGGEFTLRLRFNQPLPTDIKLRKDSLHVSCTPAVNLFLHHAEPIRPNGDLQQYPLQASHQDPYAYDIFRVKSVTNKIPSANDGPEQRSNSVIHWPEFESFKHQVEYRNQREVIYWHHRTRTSLFHRGLDHSIAFVHANGDVPNPARLKGAVINPLLVCTNRMLPIELNTGDISVAVSKNPAVASFSNITCPTRPLDPVMDGDMHWSLISSMNLNYLSLLDRDALVNILRTFDIPGIHHPQRARLSQPKLDAIEKMETHPVDRLFKGIPVRGLATTLWINPAPFICEGEIYLLGAVLSHFFALYASIVSFHLLKIINAESQEVWEWESTGQHALM